ncbi:MAG: ABC-three component system middle component 8 [Candidatus Electrothrix sp. GW3-4]|uniref:ABC-three component system middle component 8 n=1 Tax=Candidatus Electrothrix sp. GW3-4 TaxID=3126740 RepID=UPI0030CB2CAC
MLRPTKHSHPDRTVINVSLLLLDYLKKYRIEEYGKLRRKTKEKITGGDVLFLPALSFLYLLGLVEYRSKSDVIEYVGPDEAV